VLDDVVERSEALWSVRTGAETSSPGPQRISPQPRTTCSSWRLAASGPGWRLVLRPMGRSWAGRRGRVVEVLPQDAQNGVEWRTRICTRPAGSPAWGRPSTGSGIVWARTRSKGSEAAWQWESERRLAPRVGVGPSQCLLRAQRGRSSQRRNEEALRQCRRRTNRGSPRSHVVDFVT